MTLIEIGCCGAYCRTCRGRKEGNCRGCKLGYDTGERDIERSKCWIKLCCFKERGLQTCADCCELEICERIQAWFSKGYKYERYRRAIYYIKDKGYESFLKKADGWKDAKGKL
ncbi:MAG: DUF3795 domain-containing protein [Thermoplasmatota archaeon]